MSPRSQTGETCPARLRGALLLALVLAFTFLGTSNAFAITRDTVLARAQTWIDSPVPYSQSRYFGGYRTDCSGYASMCWQTGTSWATASFHNVTHRIKASELKPGDAMLKAGYHIRIFYGWVDTAHTRYVTYEQTGPSTTSSTKSMADDLAFGYVPTRYDRIVDSPVPGNALKNGSYDVWARGEPVWWEPTGPDRWTDVVAHRQDVYKTARNSLQLINPSGVAGTFAAVSQPVPVTAQTTYTLSAWAQTTADPASFELRLTYLDAAGSTLAEARTAGNSWGLDASMFRKMTLKAVSPRGAVSTIVTVRLTRGSAEGTATRSATFDDVWLTAPPATTTIRTRTSTAYAGKTAVLSGSVTPTGTVGRGVVVYVRTPGSTRWSYSPDRRVYTKGERASWSYGYPFRAGMAKGVYSFRAEVMGSLGQASSMSAATAVVRLK